ncbi:MAG TPA: hypothetical protein PLZ86_08040, partial [bacterium]|nr:hypothetical protein [bacterium]
MKRSIRTVLVFAFALFLSSCGGSADTTAVGEEGRLITGELDAEASAMLAKAAGDSGSCIGEVCAIVAYNANGGESQ